MRAKTIYTFITLVALSLFCLTGCDKKDKDGNFIFVPDFIEHYNKKSVNNDINPPEVIKIAPTPTPAPKKVVVEKAVTPIVVAKPYPAVESVEYIRNKIIKNAEKYLYVRETNGNNRSKEIDKWKKFKLELKINNNKNKATT